MAQVQNFEQHSVSANGHAPLAHLHVVDAPVCEDEADGVAEAGRRGGDGGRLLEQRPEQRRAR